MIPPEGRRKCSPDVTICRRRQENHLKLWLCFCLVCRVAALLVLFAISCLTHDIRAVISATIGGDKKECPTTVQKPGAECLKCTVLRPEVAAMRLQRPVWITKALAKGWWPSSRPFYLLAWPLRRWKLWKQAHAALEWFCHFLLFHLSEDNCRLRYKERLCTTGRGD